MDRHFQYWETITIPWDMNLRKQNHVPWDGALPLGGTLKWRLMPLMVRLNGG